MKNRTKTLRGLTLMEALLFLGLMAVVIVGAFALYSNATGASDMNEARTQLQTYIGGVKSFYSAQNDFSSVNTAFVVNAGIAPTAAVDGNALINPWGGNTVIEGSTRDFRVTFQGVPSNACTGLLSTGLIEQGTVIQMGVGNTLYSNTIDPATALSLCSTESNNVVFVSR